MDTKIFDGEYRKRPQEGIKVHPRERRWRKYPINHPSVSEVRRKTYYSKHNASQEGIQYESISGQITQTTTQW